jgi:shikimate kinase
MFTSLAQFYNSTEWRTFRLNLIAERTNKKDGILYDELSGKPLLQSYDIVLHHIKPLTMQNVNDYSISLNPENIMIVSQRSHNEIHKRFGYCTERKVYFVYGAPCSGKTTFVQTIKGNSDIVVDMDNIWQCITGGARYEKPNALKTNAFILRDCLYDSVKTRAGKWERAFVISGGAVKGERERILATLGAEPIFIDTDRETCLQRLASDQNRTETQRQEWTRYIDKWFEEYQE